MMSKFVYIGLLLFVIGPACITTASTSPSPELKEVIVHTDRPLYVVGETLWFTAYFCSDQNRLFSSVNTASVDLLDRHGNTVLQSRIRIKNGVGSGHMVLESTIPSGNYVLNVYPIDILNHAPKNVQLGTQVLLLNPKNLSTITHREAKPYMSERSARIINERNTNDFHHINIKSQKTHYKKREKIELIFDSIDAILSISVYKADSTLPYVSSHIRFPSSTMEAIYPIEFPTEKFAPIVCGTIGPLDFGNACLLMSIPGKKSYLNSLNVNSGGAFHFEYPPNMTSDKVCFAIIGNDHALHPIQPEIQQPFSHWSSPPAFDFELSEIDLSYLNSVMTNMQIGRIYNDYSLTQGLPPSDHHQVDDQFYGVPNYVYYLKDYVKFHSFQELFRSIVKEASLHKRNGQWYFHLKGMVRSSSCAVFIDGMPIGGAMEALQLEPSQIERIEIVSEPYQLSANRFENGMINIITVEGAYSPKHTDRVFCTQITSLQRSSSFFCPSYEDPELQVRKIPDYRNTLYWNPYYDTCSDNNRIALYASDDVGDYRIEVIGVDKSGQKIYGNASFTVD